jgi:hypothetical protein
MAQFSPEILNSTEVTLSTFADEELDLLNKHVLANYSQTIFTTQDFALITTNRSTYLNALRNSGINSAEPTFKFITQFIKDKFTAAGVPTALQPLEELWKEIPTATGTYTPQPVSPANFDRQTQTQMTSNISMLLSRGGTDAESLLVKLSMTLSTAAMVSLIKSAMGIPDATKFHQDPKFTAKVMNQLLKLRNQNPVYIAENLKTALNQLPNTPARTVLISKMNLNDYWTAAGQDVNALYQQLALELSGSLTNNPGTYPGNNTQATKTFQRLTVSLTHNYYNASDEDKQRLDIAAVLMNGNAFFDMDTLPATDRLGKLPVILILTGTTLSNMAAVMTQQVVAAVATGNPIVMNAVSKPILESVYGSGAADSIVSVTQQQSSIIKGTSGPKTSLVKPPKREDTKAKVDNATGKFDFFRVVSDITMGVADYKSNVNNLGPVDATAAYLKGAVASMVGMDKSAKFDNPVSRVVGVNKLAPLYDVATQDALITPANNLISSAQANANVLLNEVQQSILFGKPIPGFEEAKTPEDFLKALGARTFGPADKLGETAFPWLKAITGDKSGFRNYVAGTGAFDQFLGVSDGKIVLKGNGGIRKINNGHLDATPGQVGSLPKPRVFFSSKPNADPTSTDTLYEFKLLPSVKHSTQLGNNMDGQEVPFPSHGITYKHQQNIASIDIPGGTPVFQSLGITADLIEIVGEIVSYGFRAPGGTRDFNLGMFPYGPEYDFDLSNKDSPGSRKGSSAVFMDNTNERTGLHAYGAWEEVEDSLMALVRSGKPVYFNISYSFEPKVRAKGEWHDGTYSVPAICYKVYLAQAQRIHPRRDKVYYKLTMIRTEWAEEKSAENVSNAAKAAAKKAEDGIKEAQKLVPTTLPTPKPGDPNPTPTPVPSPSPSSTKTPFFPTPDGKLPVVTPAPTPTPLRAGTTPVAASKNGAAAAPVTANGEIRAITTAPTPPTHTVTTAGTIVPTHTDSLLGIRTNTAPSLGNIDSNWLGIGVDNPKLPSIMEPVPTSRLLSGPVTGLNTPTVSPSDNRVDTRTFVLNTPGPNSLQGVITQKGTPFLIPDSRGSTATGVLNTLNNGFFFYTPPVSGGK